MTAKTKPGPQCYSKQDVIDDLQKSGFPSELRVVEAFSGNRWGAYAGEYFYDSRGDTYREIDVRAITYADNTLPDFEIGIDLWIEVKRRMNPWVILRGAKDKMMWLTAMSSSLTHIHAFSHSANFKQQIGSNSLGVKVGWAGHGVYEIGKEKQLWFDAVDKLSYVVRHPEYSLAFQDDNELPHVRLSIPLLVLDGQLFSARIKNGNLDVEEIQEAVITFPAETGGKRPGRMLVDVITLKALPAYIQRASQLLNDLTDEARSQLGK